ncbi:hypothetical protein, partial [Priestia megaterium]|uniref:hypothetical protein n=1 Tax=Priestia megaterium TaxID=1404 RepID=UPI00300AFEE1
PLYDADTHSANFTTESPKKIDYAIVFLRNNSFQRFSSLFRKSFNMIFQLLCFFCDTCLSLSVLLLYDEKGEVSRG